MAEDKFKPIETQEELDAVLGTRLQREREKYKNYMSPDEVMARYGNYLSPEAETEKYKGYLPPDEAAAKDKLIKQYETDSVKTRIALETGLPYEMASRLTGETEEEIRKDAQQLQSLMGAPKTQPLKSTEPEDGKQKKSDAPYKELLKSMKGE